MYVEGFVTAVPKKNKPLYDELARKIAPLFLKIGAVRVADCWQDDVPRGKPTGFDVAVKAKEDEAVVLSWIEYPSKQARDEAQERMKHDSQLQELWNNPPFEMDRMAVGTFESLMDIRKN